MKILLDGECVKQEYGEILFTDYGLSGIVSMNLSEAVSKNFECKTPKKCHAVIDLANDFSEDELLEHISKIGSLEGILGEKVSSLLEKQANGDKKKICKYAKNWQLIITGTKGYNFAQEQGTAVLSCDRDFSASHIRCRLSRGNFEPYLRRQQ